MTTKKDKTEHTPTPGADTRTQKTKPPTDANNDKSDPDPRIPAETPPPDIKDSKQNNGGEEYLPRRDEKGNLLIEGAVIHCSGSNLPKHDDIAVIDKWHKIRGWSGVGYHFFITRAGKVQTGRPLDMDPYLESDEIGAHVLGENRITIGICLSGIGVEDFTEEQFTALEDLFRDIVLPINEKAVIYGHNYFTEAKSCPNFDWFAWTKKTFPKNLADRGPKKAAKK